MYFGPFSRLILILARLTGWAKMSLSRAQNIFMPANISTSQSKPRLRLPPPQKKIL